MTYPSINGSEINGAEDAGTKGLAPVRFGLPVAAFTHEAAGLSPVRFGFPGAQNGVDVVANATGFSPVSFGLTAVAVGMPPSAVVVGPVVGLSPVRMGVPSATSAVVVDAPTPLEPVRFGVPAAAVGYMVQGLAIGRFGEPGPVALGASAAGIGPVRFGTPVAGLVFPAEGFSLVRLGPLAAEQGVTVAPAAGIAAVQFGPIGAVGVAAHARALRPVRFGTATLDLGATC